MEEKTRNTMLGISAAFVSYLLTFLLQKIESIYTANFILQLFVMFFIVVVAGYGVSYIFEVLN